MLDTLLQDFHFLRPWNLLAFVPLAFIAWRVLTQASKAGLWESVCEPELLPFVTDSTGAKTGRLHYLLLLIGSIVIVALAGPVFEKLPSPVFRQQSALVVVLDLSRSMNAEDVKPTRLERAKFKISDLLRLRKDGQTALVVFAEQAFVVTPLTNDARTIENQLPALTSDVMPSQGSNLNIAIEKAADLLQQAGVRGGDILVLTDAVDANSDALDSLVKDRGLRISAIGVGTKEGAPVSNDRGGFISDDTGNVILMSLDIVGLRDLASVGNGLFQTISIDNKDVERYARFVDSADKSNTETSTDLFADSWREFGPWLLLICLPLLPLVFRRGLIVVLLGANMSLLSQPASAQAWFLTPDQQGQRAFEKEQFNDAKTHFEDNRWRAAAAYRDGDFEAAASALEEPQSADAWYNKGNALARLGQFEDAIAAYQQAIEHNEDTTADSPPAEQLHEDAAHNKSLLEKLLEQQNQQQNQGEGEDKEGENDENQNGEAQGDSEKPSDTTQQGGDSTAESDEMNPEQEQPEEEATKSAEEEKENAKEEQSAEEEAQEAQDDDQEGGKPNEQMADLEPKSEADLEQEQATEQWLRQIPDDPGGLLRRKFEYEYRKRDARSTSGNSPGTPQGTSRGQQW